MSFDAGRTHLEIGVIGKPHGIRGELKVRLHNTGSDVLSQVHRLWLAQASSPPRVVELESVRGGAGGHIARLAGVDSREAAELLRGAHVWVARADLPPLEAGAYYLVDLVGCEVRCGERTIGRATAVRPDPTVDTLLIELLDGGHAEQPLLEPWILRVDVEARIVELASDDGLITE